MKGCNHVRYKLNLWVSIKFTVVQNLREKTLEEGTLTGTIKN